MKRSVLLIAIATICYALKAQNVGIGTVSPAARLHVADSAVVFSASGNTPVTPGNAPINGVGRRMMWYSDKAAFRVGYVDATQWDGNNVGLYSLASGLNTVATGFASTALGNFTTSTGLYSTALGSYTTASGNFSTAMGFFTNAPRDGATAIGQQTTASGLASLATGSQTIASGDASITGGLNTIASGHGSVALGYFTAARGESSIAAGYVTSAHGFNSVALGFGTKTRTVGGMSIGLFNDLLDNPDSIASASTDRLFQIGNGTSGINRSNALTVLRNGNIGIGTTTPATALHIKTADSNPVIIDGGTSMWVTLAENGNNRGYIGSYSGNPEDVELGTYGGTTGAVHLTTNNAPKLTVINNGNVGISKTNPSEKLDVAGNVKATSYKYTDPKISYYSMPPSSFQAEFPADKIYRDFGTVYYDGPPYGTYMIAPVNLPHGATVTAMTVNYVDNSTTENLRVTLAYYPHSPTNGVTMAMLVSSGNPGNASGTVSLAPSHVVNNQLWHYYIEANTHSDSPWPGFNLQIRSILITYTLSEAL